MSDKPFGRMIKEIQEIIEKNTNELSRKQDLTSAQVAILAFLHGEKGNTASRSTIQKFLNCAQPTVTGLVQRMEKKGLVEIIPDPSSRRLQLVHLTETGRLKWEAGFRYMQQVEENVLSPLTEEERDVLLNLLSRLLQ